MAEEFSYLFKCLIFGDYKVGKTTLVERLNELQNQRALEANKKNIDKMIDEYHSLREKTQRRFKKRSISNKIEKLKKLKNTSEKSMSIDKSTRTVTGVDFCTKTVKFREDYAKLQIWVLSNQERFQRFLPMYVSNSVGAIVIYDITDSNSVNRISEWCNLIKERNGNIPILLVGNKLDLKDLREISIEQGIKIKDELQLSAFMEISVKTGEDIVLMFERFTQLISEPLEN